MEDYDSDGEINYQHFLNLSNENSDDAVKSIKILYDNLETREYASEYLISKIEDENCINAGKFALIYQSYQENERIKQLMKLRSEQDVPASFTALQFNLAMEYDVITIRIDKYEKYNGGSYFSSARIERLLKKYLKSDNEYVQFESIKLLVKYCSDINPIAKYAMRILRNPQHEYYLETALCCFPFNTSMFFTDNCRSQKACFGMTLTCCILSTCLFPCTFFSFPSFLYGFYNTRPLFHTCVNIINSFLSNPEHPKSFEVAKYVISLILNDNSKDMLYIINFDQAEEILKDAVINGDNKRKKEALDCMENSIDINLMIFAMNNSFRVDRKVRIDKIARFNMEKIRSYMPSPLANLSHVEMDLSFEFTKLLDLISENENDKFYLSLNTILQDGYSGSYSEMKAFIINFIRKLEGKEEYSVGWEMYEDNKGQMINSLKHIILNIKLDLQNDSERALLSFAYVINGLLHCPTGQFEGIETAVDIIVRNRKLEDLDLKEKIGKTVIYYSVKKCFDKRFTEDVHIRSRAKMALKNELGLNFAISNFNERILTGDEDEVYEEFFDNFTVRELIREFRRNLQTNEEYNLIVSGKNKLIKKEKSINVGQIVSWLHDSKLSFEGISEDYLSISDYGIMNLLMKMEFLTEDKRNLRMLERLKLAKSF